MPNNHKSSPPAQSGFIRRAGTSVFLAEDDLELRETAFQVLSEAGFVVASAADGGEALERLAAIVDARLPLPDVLLLDFVMPKLSGLGVLRTLRHLVRLPPSLIMTGFADPSVDAFAMNVGAFRVLRKPISSEALCAAVREAAASGSAALLPKIATGSRG